MASYNPRKNSNTLRYNKQSISNGYSRKSSMDPKQSYFNKSSLNKAFSSLLNINRPSNYEMNSAKSIADISCDSSSTSSSVKIVQSITSGKSTNMFYVRPIKKVKLQVQEIFDIEAAEIIAVRLLEKKLKSLKDVDYDPVVCRRYAQSLSSEIATHLDEINFPKYRRVIIIHFGRVHNLKDIFFSSRCVWSKITDRSLCVHKSLDNLFGIVQIFAIL